MAGPTSTEQELYLIRTGGIDVSQKSGSGEFTIPDGSDGSLVSEVDLGANYDLICVTCEDAQYIAASTNLSAKVKYDSDNTEASLYEQDDPSTEWSKGALPTSGAFAFLLTHAAGIRCIRFVLSNAANGGAVVFKVTGLHKSS